MTDEAEEMTYAESFDMASEFDDDGLIDISMDGKCVSLDTEQAEDIANILLKAIEQYKKKVTYH